MSASSDALVAANGLVQNMGVTVAKNTIPAKPPQGDTSSFLDKFWNAVYSYAPLSSAADKVISVGNDVRTTRDEVITDAKKGVHNALTFGPLIIILALAAYVYVMFFPKR